MLVIDDLLLLELLGGVAPVEVLQAANRGEVFTTGSWYYRLGRAISVGTGTGSLSGRFSGLADGQRRRVLAALDELPVHLGLLSLRVVVPVMQALTVERPLNFLSAEALGAALLLDASVVVSTDAPLLRSGCADLAIRSRYPISAFRYRLNEASFDCVMSRCWFETDDELLRRNDRVKGHRRDDFDLRGPTPPSLVAHVMHRSSSN